MITFFSHINQKLDISAERESPTRVTRYSRHVCNDFLHDHSPHTQRQSPSSTRLASHAFCSLATYFLSFTSIWVLLEAKDPMNEFPHQSELEHHDFFHFYIFETISGGLWILLVRLRETRELRYCRFPEDLASAIQALFRSLFYDIQAAYLDSITVFNIFTISMSIQSAISSWRCCWAWGKSFFFLA